MKNLKLGFAAIIAIFAVGITIAASADTSKKAKVAPTVANCFGSVTTCSPVLNLAFNVSPCPGSITYGVTAASNPFNSDICDVTTQDLFCCALLVADQSSCGPVITPSPLPASKYRIQQVFCKIR